jgi:DeoR/GlpR family transcriptional regulator of sugar metabolism
VSAPKRIATPAATAAGGQTITRSTRSGGPSECGVGPRTAQNSIKSDRIDAKEPYDQGVIGAQRRNVIQEVLREEGVVSIAALSRQLSASAVTIRRDLDYLESAGVLTRIHGGAVAEVSSPESPYVEKVGQAMAEKQAIGRLAADLVDDGDVIIIGPGTTTEAFAGQLQARSGLTVITNSLPVAEVFAASDEIDVIMTGGSLRGPIRALIGETVIRSLRGMHADKTFISGNGMVADFGLSTPNLSVADTDRAMVAASAQAIVLVDHSKFGLRAAIQTVPTEGIAQVVTDASSPSAEIAAIEARGVTVHIARL